MVRPRFLRGFSDTEPSVFGFDETKFYEPEPEDDVPLTDGLPWMLALIAAGFVGAAVWASWLLFTYFTTKPT